MVGKVIRRWLGIDDIVLAMKDVPSVVMLQVMESNQKKRHEEILAALSEKSLTSEQPKPKIIAKPKAVTWKNFRSEAEKASDPQEREA